MFFMFDTLVVLPARCTLSVIPVLFTFMNIAIVMVIIIMIFSIKNLYILDNVMHTEWGRSIVVIRHSDN